MTRTTGNPCPVAGCTRQAKPNQLMCWPHWRRVPKALNRAVFETYANLRNDFDAYRRARAAAIAAVEAKQAEERAIMEALLTQAQERAAHIADGACQGCERDGCPGDASCPVPF